MAKPDSRSGQGRRLSKTVGGTTAYYMHEDQGDEIGGYTGTSATGSWTLSRKLLYDPGMVAPVAMLSASSGQFTYNHPDQQGSVMAISNASGGVVTQYAYLPYGDSVGSGSSRYAISNCLSGTCGSSAGTGFGYDGYRYDPETGLYHTGARYYDPRLGRFLQPDPIGQKGGLNIYAYVGNSPLVFSDPRGLLAGELANGAWSLTQSGASAVYGALPSRNTITGVGDVALGGVLVGLGGVEGFGAAITSETGIGAVVLGTGSVLTIGAGVQSIDNGLVLLNQKQGDNGPRNFGAQARAQADAAATDANGILRCSYCDEPMTTEPGYANSRQFDHVDAWSRGGGSQPGNAASACWVCNLLKGAKTLEEWLTVP
jgi:RHS repeat-associated protein